MRRAIELLEKLQLSGEVPATKLAALQKVLQSDFLSAVREVYERKFLKMQKHQKSIFLIEMCVFIFRCL